MDPESVKRIVANERRIDNLVLPELSADLIAPYLAAPGLRGFWPLSSFDENGDAFDLSGQGRVLTYNGDPMYNWDGLVPYLQLDGTGDYLARADEVGLDILGSESYVAAAAQGVSLYSWVWFDDAILNLESIIGKYAGVGQRSYYLFRSAGGDATFRIVDGVATRSVSIANALTDASEWNFVAGRWDRSGITIDVYVGNEDGWQTNSAAVAPAGGVLVNSNSDFRVGADGAGVNLMTGRVTMGALYVMGHSEAQIQSIFEQTRSAFGV